MANQNVVNDDLKSRLEKMERMIRNGLVGALSWAWRLPPSSVARG